MVAFGIIPLLVCWCTYQATFKAYYHLLCVITMSALLRRLRLVHAIQHIGVCSYYLRLAYTPIFYAPMHVDLLLIEYLKGLTIPLLHQLHNQTTLLAYFAYCELIIHCVKQYNNVRNYFCACASARRFEASGSAGCGNLANSGLGSCGGAPRKILTVEKILIPKSERW